VKKNSYKAAADEQVFPITAEMRAKMIEKLGGLLDSADWRSQSVAFRSVLDAEKLNLAREQFDDQRDRLDTNKPTSIVGASGNISVAVGAILADLQGIGGGIEQGGRAGAIEVGSEAQGALGLDEDRAGDPDGESEAVDGG
jgi:hypothetical protein